MMTVGKTRQRWRKLARASKHRTSAPTDTAIRDAMNDVADSRADRRRPYADAVILAALRKCDPRTLRIEVERIEAELFEVDVQPPAGNVEHDPGS